MDESRGSWDGNDPSGLKHDAHPALPFRNSVTDMGNSKLFSTKLNERVYK